MSDVLDYANDLLELSKYAQEFKQKVNSACNGSFEYGVEQIIESYLSLFKRFCPFKVGDRVELIKDVKLDESSGWWHSRHFLKQYAPAVIKECGYNNGAFTFAVFFDDESWIDSDKSEHLSENKHLYHFGEKAFKAWEPRAR